MTFSQVARWPHRVDMRTALPAVVIVVIGLLYAIRNVGSLGAQGYWTDELLSVGFANEELERMLRLLGGDNHPPFYSSVVWLWIRVTGTATEATVRFVSLAAISVGIVVLGLAVWRKIGIGASAVMVALAASSTLVATFAREARPHGLGFGLVCLATAAWLMLLGTKPLRRRYLALFAVFGGLTSLTQYYGMLVYAVEVAVLIGWLARDRRWREGALTLAMTGLSVVPIVVWLAVTSRLLHASSTPPLTPAWAEEVAAWVTQPFTAALAGGGTLVLGGFFLVSVTLVVSVMGLLFGFVQLHRNAPRHGPRPDPRALQQGAAAWATGVIAVSIAVVESLLWYPTVHYRSMMGILPVLYVGIGAALTVPFRRLGTVAGIGVAVLLAAIAIQTPEPGRFTKDQWRETSAIVLDAVRGGLPASRVAVVESPWGTRVDWILALNNAAGRRAPASDLPAALHDLTWINGPADITALSSDQRVFVVAFHYWTPDRDTAITDATRDRFGPCEDRSLQGITVLDCGAALAVDGGD